MKLEIKIIEKQLDVKYAGDFVKNISSGAIVLFEGVVREYNNGVKIKNIEYSAYELMAIKEIKKIINIALKKIINVEQVHAICIHHRIGKLQIGDTAVVIAVATEHRKEAFELASNIMDLIKKTVPIWKQESSEESAH
ncbi:MAG: molybdenum cofactor biosynthesis protein MoaE [Dehalococcoidia bacterium]|jgi:molybdopterin synthase catalytic subunit|nr:MAG: molybdopterin synthase catalytic subunit [Chloroflexota bacterium]|tara:strand:+ start:2868 stop:3281 length:414 start_codon:yes stop_codon:yes gene_type:complete